jgi:3'-phosphoadenosine 5'-phosphosulfate sulfotransferase (PAPS reductase)/FAD synthetase
MTLTVLQDDVPACQEPGKDRRPNTTTLLPLDQYNVVIVSFSGGKDSLACLLHLLDLGVPRHKIQLWHQCVDGDPETQDGLMDWPVTHSYAQAVADALGVRIFYQWRQGGFEREMLRDHQKTAPCTFQRQDGSLASAGGLRGPEGTRLKFPQVSANLSVRWCSAALKIDVAALAINNDPDLKTGKFLFVTGERRQESTARSLYAEMEPHRSNCQRRRVDQWRAIIDWSEADVWAIIERYRVQPHPAYKIGFGRVSCMTCIFALADQWATIRIIAPTRFARVAARERQSGLTIHRTLTVDQQADRGTPFEGAWDPILVDLALGTTYSESIILPANQRWVLPAGAFKEQGGPT